MGVGATGKLWFTRFLFRSLMCNSLPPCIRQKAFNVYIAIMRAATIIIPQPCAESWAAMTPTAAGRHCAACQTEVVDFTRMSEAEILSYLAARPKQRVCSLIAAPAATPRYYKRKSGFRRWLLAAAAFFGAHHVSALNLPPQRPPIRTASFFWAEVSRATITIRGLVLDDSLGVPLQGAQVRINGGRYGAVTDEHGEFVLTMRSNWRPVHNDTFELYVSMGHFIYEGQTIKIDLAALAMAPPLVVRLSRLGVTMGKIHVTRPPVPPPGSRKARR